MIHVGANTIPRWGGFRAPIFPNGEFIFIPIPWSDDWTHARVNVPTYYDMGWKSFIGNAPNRKIWDNPQLTTLTYAHLGREPGNIEAIYNTVKENGYLLFMASLKYWDKPEAGPRQPWINPRWGVYLVGYFRLKCILSNREFEQSSVAQNDFTENPQYIKKQLCKHFIDERNLYWIKGSEGRKLNIAFPLSNSENPQMPNDFTKRTFRTVRGDIEGLPPDWFRRTLLCEGDKSDLLIKAIKTR